MHRLREVHWADIALLALVTVIAPMIPSVSAAPPRFPGIGSMVFPVVAHLSGAFSALRAQPYGWVLLAIVAAGHFAFGAFGLIQARYRHIDAPDLGDADGALTKAVRAAR